MFILMAQMVKNLPAMHLFLSLVFSIILFSNKAKLIFLRLRVQDCSFNADYVTWNKELLSLRLSTN